MQLLAKFEKILYMGFRGTLNFSVHGVQSHLKFLKIEGNSEPHYRIFSNFAKSCISYCFLKFYNEDKFHCAIFEI